MAKQTEWAWSAGFLDGEGYFHATKRQHYITKDGSLGHVKNKSRFLITVAQSDTRVLKRLQKVIGGSISGPYTYPPSKPYWNLAVCTNADAVFKKLLPYLPPVKKAQGKAAIIKVKELNAL